MTYPQDTGALSASFLQSADHGSIGFPNGTVARYVAPGTLTDNRFGLFEWNMTGVLTERDTGHFHKEMIESFYVISGEIMLFDGKNWNAARQGDFLHVPEGGVHGFCNESGAPASMLVLFTPGVPREKYFEELAEIRSTGRKLDYDEWTELFAKYDQYRA